MKKLSIVKQLRKQPQWIWGKDKPAATTGVCIGNALIVGQERDELWPSKW